MGVDGHILLVMPAAAGIQRLKSLDPGQKHAGMTTIRDNNASRSHFTSGNEKYELVMMTLGSMRVTVFDFFS